MPARPVQPSISLHTVRRVALSQANMWSSDSNRADAPQSHGTNPSAVRKSGPCARPNSLVTGKKQGISCFLSRFQKIGAKNETILRVAEKFPRDPNREFIRRCREIEFPCSAKNRDISRLSVACRRFPGAGASGKSEDGQTQPSDVTLQRTTCLPKPHETKRRARIDGQLGLGPLRSRLIEPRAQARFPGPVVKFNRKVTKGHEG